MRQSERNASRGGSAACRCGSRLHRAWLGALALGLAAAVLAGCTVRPDPTAEAPAPALFRVHAADPPSSEERYCAWFGEASDGVLYFGQSAFWSSYRAAGLDARADLARPGPRPLGRFDLDLRQMLDPIETGPRPDGSPTRSGVWDVLPLYGRVFFTTYFEEAGAFDLKTGQVTLFPDSRHWNELAGGPVVSHQEGFSTTARQTLLVSRYADRENGGGAVLVIDPDGQVLRSLVLPAPEGRALAAKTPAWDPVTRQVWITSDRLPIHPGEERLAASRPTLVLDMQGREVARFGTALDQIEVQFVRFDSQGLGYVALSREGRLELAILAPTTSRLNLDAVPTAVLDASYPAGLDFAQDIQIAPDGSAFVTRWSGLVHQVSGSRGLIRTWALPRDGDALYYTAVPAGADGAVCATRCGGVEVVCASPAAARTR